MGAVLHTLNIRLFAEQLTYIVNHAEDRVIFVDDSLVPVLEKLAPTLRDRRALRRDGRRRRRLAAERAALRGAAGGAGAGASTTPSSTSARPPALCYTSGTTGNPKGVLYSHRSIILHAMATLPGRRRSASARDDRVLPVVPMFHANAWGLPVRGRAGRRRPGHARAASCRPSRSPRLIEAERVDAGGRGADDLARRAALRRRAHSPTSRALRTRRVRRLGGAARR